MHTTWSYISDIPERSSAAGPPGKGRWALIIVKSDMGCTDAAGSIEYDEALARLQEAATNHWAPSKPMQTCRCIDTITGPNCCHRCHQTTSAAYSERIPFAAFAGRRCAQTILAPFQTPSVDTSAMDGFAISTALTQHASASHPIKMRVVGMMAAGDESLRPVQNHDTFTEDSLPICVEIMTGAPFPEMMYPDLDGVVKVEDAVEIVPSKGSSGWGCDRYIEIRTPAVNKQHRRPAGTDYKRGDIVVSAGETIKPRHIMALASLGYQSEVDPMPELNGVSASRDCCRPIVKSLTPKIGVLSTGSELIDVTTMPGGESIADIQLYDSNGPYLCHALSSRHAVHVQYLGTVKDQIELVEQRISIAIDSLDIEILIMTGGVSKGRFDFTRHIIEECFDGKVVFHGVKMRPGAPVLFATMERRLPHSDVKTRRLAVFGLPGNPLAAAAGLQFFVRPYLDFLKGMPGNKPMQLLPNCSPGLGLLGSSMARIITPLRKDKVKPAGLVAFWLARHYKIAGQGGEKVLVAEVFADQASYKVNMLARSTCWVIVPAGIRAVSDGSWLATLPL